MTPPTLPDPIALEVADESVNGRVVPPSPPTPPAITPTYFGSHWQTIRVACKVLWSDLTEADLDRVAGSFNRLMFLLQIKYGYSLIQAESEFQKRMIAHEATSPPPPALS